MSGSTGLRARPLAVIALLALASGVGACSCSDGSGPSSVADRPSNPLAGRSLYVDPGSPAAQQAAALTAAGRTRDAAAARWLARRPTAVWFADGGNPAGSVRALSAEAAASRTVPVLVAYFVPNRDCGSFSAGGAPSAAAYRAWIRGFARGVGDRRAVVILEPDALPASLEGCGSRAQRAERLALVRYAVRTLKRRSGASVYVDAGNPGWIRPGSRLVGPLRGAGIASADGFSLNVSNFYSTASVLSYGRALSRRLGGAHFVIDTSRNGKGPARRWCNPPGRAPGRDPTTTTGRPLVDAYLWIKVPGESDGACRRGEPPAGAWWSKYAVELFRNRRAQR